MRQAPSLLRRPTNMSWSPPRPGDWRIAAHGADLHPGEGVVESRLPGIEHLVRLGGEGTPPSVGDFAAAEVGCALRISDGSAARLIGDVLDLRHRLPVIWAVAEAGGVPAYQARCIAEATRHLSVEQAAAVDARIAPLTWCRAVGPVANPVRCSRR
jgi:Domain of unknown function (DUF222)